MWFEPKQVVYVPPVFFALYPPSVLSIVVVVYLLSVIPSPLSYLLNNFMVKHVVRPNSTADVSDVIGMTLPRSAPLHHRAAAAPRLPRGAPR
jgi:hypothetical protein